MKQRLKAMVVTVLAVLLGFSSVYAAPVRLSSIKYDKMKKPTFVARDAQGNIYVSETAPNVVRIFDQKGVYLKSLAVERPLGLAIDSAGMIYVCSEKRKRIEVYNPDLTFARILGDAEGDVRSSSITIDSKGNIYVVNNFNNKIVRSDVVNVYNANGGFAFSFGSTGSTNGLFNQPTGLAINEAMGEIYVADAQVIQTATGPTSGARIQAFDLNGKYLRTVPVKYGTGAGQITSPVSLAVDQAGKLYVSDSYQQAVLIFDARTGMAGGALYDMTVPLQIPIGVTIGRDNIAFVASYGGASVEEYGLDGYVKMNATPTGLTFAAQQYGVNPDVQSITISNSGSGSLSWSASADQPWLVCGVSGVPTSGTIPAKSSAAFSVGVNIAALTPGNYSGMVTITSGAGYKVDIPVTLALTPSPMLTLNPGWLNFSAKRTKTAALQAVAVELLNVASLQWSASADPSSPWIGVTPASGITSTSVFVAVNTASLATGTYTGVVTFSAPGALGDGSKLMVNLAILPFTRINVSTNRPEAAFLVSGVSSYNGAGIAWNVEDAPIGDYTISYAAVAGYRKPASQTKLLSVDSEISFTGTYVSWKDMAARKNILTSRGPWIKNDGLIKTYKGDGTAVSPDFIALDSKYGANVAIGDVDGDGAAEIIVGAGAGSENSTLVRIYKADKTTILTEFEAFPGMHGGVNISAVDFNADGQAEIVVAPAGGAEASGVVKVYAYDSSSKSMVTTGIEFVAHSNLSGVNIAAADIEGSLLPMLVTAPVSGSVADPGSIKIWKIDCLSKIGSWSASAAPIEIALQNRYGATLAAGDIDGDGKDEIIAGIGSDSENALVKIFRSDGVEVKRMQVFDGKYGVNVAAADLDGDGIAEVIAGIGVDLGGTSAVAANDKENRRNKKDKMAGQKITTGTVRVYSAAGIMKYSITPYDDARYGVKVTVGDMGL